MPDPFEMDIDPQDQAETRDETMFDDTESAEFRTFEEEPDVLDVTQLDGDRDDDEALALDADEFDEDAIGDEEFEEDDELDYRAAADYEDDDDLDDDEFDEDALDGDEIEGLDEEVGDADLVTGGEDDFTNFQARNVGDEDLRRMGYVDDTPDGGSSESDRISADRRLDEGLKETFPASDPVSITTPQD